MSQLTVNNQRLEGTTLVKLRAGQEAAAQKAAKKNGADDVFFRINQDTYVASGRGLNLKGVKPGNDLTLNGKRGTVTHVDNQANTAKEGAVRVFKPSAWGIGAAGGLGALGGGLLGAIEVGAYAGAYGVAAGAAGASIAGATALGAASLAIPAVVAAGVAVGGSALYSAKRSVDTEALKAFGEVVR